MKLGFSLKSENQSDAKAVVIKDNSRIKAIYNKMLDMRFTHYKKYSDDLVVLEISVI